MALQIARSATLEDARKAVMSADAAVSNAANKLGSLLDSGDEVDPQIHRVFADLIRVHKTMMRATKTLTHKRLRRS